MSDISKVGCVFGAACFGASLSAILGTNVWFGALVFVFVGVWISNRNKK